MAGLLGDFDLKGLLEDPLFRIGTGLMAAGGPQAKPHSFGQDLNTAIEGYQKQTDMDLQRQMQALQMKQLKAKMASQEKADLNSDEIMKLLQGGFGQAPTATTPSTTPVAPNPIAAGDWRSHMPKEYAPYFQNAVKGLKHADQITPELLQSLAETEAAKKKDGSWDPLSVGPPIPSMANQTAKGLTQFTDSTFASEFPNEDPQNRFNPEKSIGYTAQYLDRLIDRTGSLHSALRVYGGGMNKPVTQGYADTILGRLQQQAQQGVPMPADGGGAPMPPPDPNAAQGAPTPITPPPAMPAPDATGVQAQPGPQMVPPPSVAPAPMPATPTYQPPAPAAVAPPMAPPAAPPGMAAAPSAPINADFWGPVLARRSPIEKMYIANTLAGSSDPMKQKLGEGMLAVITQEMKQQAEASAAIAQAGPVQTAKSAAQLPFDQALEATKNANSKSLEQTKMEQGLYAKAIDAGDKGKGQLEKLGFLEATLEGVRTGAFADTRNAMQKMLAAFGVDDPKMIEEASKFGASKTVMNALILAGRDPANGGGMPGAMSDNDLRFLKDMVANSENLPATNMIVIGHLKRIAARQVAMSQEADTYAATHNGGIGAEFRMQMRGWEKNQSAADLAATKQDILLAKKAFNPPADAAEWKSPTGQVLKIQHTPKLGWVFYGTDVKVPQ